VPTLDRIQPAAIGLLDLGRANLDAKAPGFFCALERAARALAEGER
jgi:hypothetical protein